MRLMVKVLGEVRQKRYKTKPLFFFFYYYYFFISYHRDVAAFLRKKRTRSVMRGKHCTFFLTELCETGSLFLLYTHHVADQKMNIVHKVLTVVLINSWFIKLQVSTKKKNW